MAVAGSCVARHDSSTYELLDVYVSLQEAEIFLSEYAVIVPHIPI